MKIIVVVLFTIFALLSCYRALAQLQKKVNKSDSQKFASNTYLDGDIILEMRQDNQFVLEIKKWDSSKLMHTHIDTIKGKFIFCSEDTLQLISDDNIKIMYKHNDFEMSVMGNNFVCDSWSWICSSEPLKLDSIELVDKNNTDSIFLNLFKDELDQLNDSI